MSKHWKICFYIILCYFHFFTTISADETKLGSYSGAKATIHPSWFKQSFLNLEEDITEATINKKRLVVYFWQPGCPYCNQLWKENFAAQDILKNFRNNFEIIALNIWGDREVISVSGNDYTEKSFAKALGIRYTPTLLFFDENRKVVHQLNGYVPPKDFRHSIEYVSKKHEKKSSFAEYSAAKNKPNTIGKLIEEDFFQRPTFNLDRTKIISDKYLAVFFESINCENCSLLHEKTLQDQTTRALVKNFTSIQLDRFSKTPVITPSGNLKTAIEWATQLGISYLPAIIFFDQKGKEVMRIDTQMRTFHIQSIFDYVLSGAYKNELNFQRYISKRADKIREQGTHVDIFAY